MHPANHKISWKQADMHCLRDGIFLPAPFRPIIQSKTNDCSLYLIEAAVYPFLMRCNTVRTTTAIAVHEAAHSILDK